MVALLWQSTKEIMIVKSLRILIVAAAIGALALSTGACAAPRQSGDAVQNAIAQNFGDYPAMNQKAVAVARCESGLDPNAYNPNGGYYGLFQLSRYWHEGLANSMGYQWSQINDPYVNARVARQVYNQAGGWGPWSCA